MQPQQTRVLKVSIPKSLTPISKCAQCRGGKAEQIVHIHEDDLVKLFEGDYYYTVKSTSKEKFEKPMKWAMKQRWFREGLEPLDLGDGKDTMFSDGKDEFACVSLCRQKVGFVRKALELGMPKISADQARELLTKSITEEWQFTPMAR